MPATLRSRPGRGARCPPEAGRAFCLRARGRRDAAVRIYFPNRFLGVTEPEREAELAAYIRSVQSESHGGWPLYHGGKFNMLLGHQAYYALKMVGDLPDAPHMARARAAILANGGAETSNVFTRYSLAIFGYSCRGTACRPCRSS